ncbi:MAG: hypothetical protein ACEY3F_07965 [Wolbachia sp.]
MKSSIGNTPLYEAAKEGYLDIVWIFLNTNCATNLS